MNDMLPDIPRVYTAIAEWLACMVQIAILHKRLKHWQTGVLSIFFLAAQSCFLIFTDHVPISMWLLCMLVAMMGMLLFLTVCCKEKGKVLICACVKAFLLAEFAASLEWQFHCFLLLNSVREKIFELPLLLLVYLTVFFCAWRLEKRTCCEVARRPVTKYEIIWVLMIGGISFLFSNISFTSVISPFSGKIIFDNFYIRTLIDLSGLIILYAYQGRLNELYILNEWTNLDNLYKSQYENYKRFQENMDVINIKYHDLKHQIRALRSEQGKGEWRAFLDEMEQEIEENYIFFNTGNHVLDTILAEKTLVCKKEQIDLTCMIDGELLEFMNSADICSVFGNALDNAIEHVRTFQEKDRRLISVSVKQQFECVYIKIRNYAEHARYPEKGHFQIESTKKDKQEHGYGLKSIRRTVEKYNGSCAIRKEGDWFVLQILFEKREEKSR